MEVPDEALVILAGPSRQRFLVALSGHVTLRARAEYIEAGHNDERQALAALRAINEVMIVIVKQLKSTMDGKPAYPDEAFLQVISEKAAIGGCEEVVRAALIYAVKEMQGQWPQAASAPDK